MIRAESPSAVLYAALKECGLANREAAMFLLNTELTFDGRRLSERIGESSQLSRRIVHTLPGEVPASLFGDFTRTCPALEARLLARLGSSRRVAGAQQPWQTLEERLVGSYAPAMECALDACGIDASLYHNMVGYIEQADLPHEEHRARLHLMMLVITGCLGDPKAASDTVVAYATERLGADFHTAHTITNSDLLDAAPAVKLQLGLVRVVDGSIKAGSRIWPLDPAGTHIGLLRDSAADITDVGIDVSRQHARIWREDSRWLLRDLGSTNGTRLISGATGVETTVGTTPDEAVEIAATDTICLGATTRFLVMPVLGA